MVASSSSFTKGGKKQTITDLTSCWKDLGVEFKLNQDPGRERHSDVESQARMKNGRQEINPKTACICTVTDEPIITDAIDP